MIRRLRILTGASLLAGAALAGHGAVSALPDDTTTTSTSSTTSSSSTTTPTTTTTTSTTSTAPPIACTVQSAVVSGGTAMFTVGPAECTVAVGPISFSTYSLPGGWRQPYEAQVLIAHAPQNGASYGPGTYTLTAPLGDACNWQSDLYRSASDDQPPLIRLLGYDYVEGEVCESPTTTYAPTSTTATTSTTTTTVATSSTSDVRDTTTTTAPTPTTAATSTIAPTSTGGPTTMTPTSLVGNAGGATTTTQAESAVPTTVVAGSPGVRATTTIGPSSTTALAPDTGSLPSTGAPLVGGLLAIGLGALLLGALLRRLAGNPPA